MQIDWWTLGLQGINFLVLVWLLSRFLFKPVKEVIEKRRALSAEALAKSQAMQADLDARTQALDAEHAAFAREKQDALNKLHQDFAAEKERLLELARAEARDLVAGARDQTAKERATVLADVRRDVVHLAVDTASRLLSGLDAEVVTAAALEKLRGMLDAMPAREAEALKRDLGDDGARVVVVTPADLAPDAQAVCRDHLQPFVDGRDIVDFVVDPAVLGGAELRFPHATLAFTWAEQLQQAERALNGDEAAS